MKPAAFEYFAPDSAEEIAAILSGYGGEARVLAGGQSLVPLLNMVGKAQGACRSGSHRWIKPNRDEDSTPS
jgi:hypothetical protein